MKEKSRNYLRFLLVLYTQFLPKEIRLFTKKRTVFIFIEANRRLNSFFQKGSVSKIVWLRNGNIIAKDFFFVIDYDGEFLVSSENQLLKVIDLNASKEKKFYRGKNFYGTALVFFY